MADQPKFSLTRALIASDPPTYTRATQSTFLARAAQGNVSRDVLGQWLANDRLYIHSYIRGTGRLLSFLSLPETVAVATSKRSTPTTRLLAWTIDALANIQREEAFFVHTAALYGINVNLPADDDGHVPASAKLEGLRRFEALFDSLGPGRSATDDSTSDDTLLPWLECAVVFWGTEKCYLDAWTWARSRQDAGADPAQDEDGGALRKEFIPNWTSDGFVAFVDKLGNVIDDAVANIVEKQGEQAKNGLMERALDKWRPLLDAEQAFWPAME